MLFTFAFACSSDLTLGTPFEASCISNRDCPGALLCLEVAQRCVRAGEPCVVVRGTSADALLDGIPCERGGVAGICLTGSCVPSLCGDGIVTAPEACDAGADNADRADACRTDCTRPRCGDGILDTGEECELGGETCTPECLFPACGDGFLADGEECDDGNDVATDACVDCRLATCGDGQVWDGVEACDDGNENPTDGCNVCGLADCGNATLDGVEQCDDGNTDATDACLPSCFNARCGDGFLRVGVEECDGGSNNGADGQSCTSECTLDRCGNGQVGPDEVCDDGADNGTALSECAADCTPSGCGDGRRGAFEQCDDGEINGTATSGCLETCQFNVCGDGVTGLGEQCDLALENGARGSNCTELCLLNRCGDEHVGPDEECDRGVQNGVPGSACTASCLDDVCGDDHRGNDEQCDLGATNGQVGSACTSVCLDDVCGDSHIGDDEECDLGDFSGTSGQACTSLCLLNVCGDGHLGPLEDEACDLGPLTGVDGETCTATCTENECGDGHLGPAVDEECDLGAALNGVFGQTCSAICCLDDDFDAICTSEDVCFGDNARGDPDADGVCPPIEQCAAGDDGVDSDSDGRPDACDTAPADPTVSDFYVDAAGLLVSRPEACGSGDENADGISVPTGDSAFDAFGHSVIIDQMADRPRVNAGFYLTTANVDSPFGVVAAGQFGTDFARWESRFVGYLPPGRYVHSMRLFRPMSGLDVDFSIQIRRGDGTRDCVNNQNFLWSGTTIPQGWSETPSDGLVFEVTEDSVMEGFGIACPVNVRMESPNGAKNDWLFDFQRIRRACTAPAECDDGEPTTTDSCVDGVCSYACE